MHPSYLHSPHWELSLFPHGEYLRDTLSICLLTKMVPASNPALLTHTSLLAVHLRLDFSHMAIVLMFICLWLFTLLLSFRSWVTSTKWSVREVWARRELLPWREMRPSLPPNVWAKKVRMCCSNVYRMLWLREPITDFNTPLMYVFPVGGEVATTKICNIHSTVTMQHDHNIWLRNFILCAMVFEMSHLHKNHTKLKLYILGCINGALLIILLTTSLVCSHIVLCGTNPCITVLCCVVSTHQEVLLFF